MTPQPEFIASKTNTGHKEGYIYLYAITSGPSTRPAGYYLQFIQSDVFYGEKRFYNFGFSKTRSINGYTISGFNAMLII